MQTDPTVSREREKYEKMWTYEQYRGNRSNVPQAERFIGMARMAPGMSVLDIGCGPGYASRVFHAAGLNVVALDIAANAIESDLAELVDFHCISIWDLPSNVRADFGFCTDTMEHIPPEMVDRTLTAIRRAVRRSVYFEISMRKDGCGRLIDDVLHLTVKPLEWWQDKLGEFWASVELIAQDYRDKSAVFLVKPNLPKAPALKPDANP